VYEKYLKRIIDVICALLVIAMLGWLYALVALLVRIHLGSPVLFKQLRPGKKEKNGEERIFCLYKFRTMTDARNEQGTLLADDKRMTNFGKRLRDMSLDEIPEVWNILKGDMSVVGPRPQLVRDMVFMTEEQRMRHNVLPGLTGLAQINGRNGIEWEDKLNYDLEYINHISFLNDFKIVIATVASVLRKENINYEGMATAEDFGDYLLRTGQIDRASYEEKMKKAIRLLDGKRMEI
jgi:Sugar transferases involved in lipopolysaccharide synthesis